MCHKLLTFGEIGAIFSVQLSWQTQFAKSENKKVIAENQCEKHKEGFFFQSTAFRCENDTHEMRFMLNWQILLSVDKPYKQIRPRSWAACLDLVTLMVFFEKLDLKRKQLLDDKNK